ncbi:MAG: MmgE/PrpD family protein, partial [Rhodospirillales bacterium]
ETVNPAHYAFWHTTGTIGTFGAAAAACTILGLNREQALNALANAGTLAAGLQQAFRGDAMAKPMHGGHAADTGLMCALTAGAGVTGIHDMLEGERGFGNAMCGGVDWSRAAATLGSDFTILRMTVKNHAACGHAHAAIDGALQLQKDHGFKAADVARIDAGTYGPAVEIVGAQETSSAFEAKFSLPYCVAVALLDGSCRMKAFTDERRADPAIHALAKKIFVAKDTECDAAFPKRRSAKVRVTLADGSVHEFYAPTRRGDPDAPLTDAELSEKYRELATAEIGPERTLALENTIWSLQSLARVADLYPGIRAAAE